ncbi:hypothetical protein NLU13_4073 [Sarocladium strictum]|uniref:N-acetyltransferase domain-containing protein n=1 Tax=Sarocladium strictum TaxID=5046 RepID=A0AA39L8A8_SARSR|nr:hypothetical protein NLU13_4073 [Sarocladium strictum]
MSLPTTAQGQSSIRSFFQSKAPKYAPPPSSVASKAAPTAAAPPPPPPPPPPASRTPPQATAPYPPPPPSLPQNASIRPLSTDDIAPLRRINTLLLPVPYPPDFYARAADPTSSSGRYSRVISYNHDDKAQSSIVGGIVCRLVDDPANPTQQHIYISSLCLLAPYRGLGLVSAALDHIVSTAILDKGCDVTAVTAHVWTGHEDSLEWYQRRGFVRQEPAVEGYYLKLRPASAWIVRRNITNRVASSLPKATPPPPPKSSTSSTNGSSPPSKAGEATVPLSATAAVVNLPSSSSAPPPPRAPLPHNGSFQNQRPDMEWNDLPADMAPGLLVPSKKANSSETGSVASSRSSSTVRKKRDRSYPAAAFGAK